MSPFLDSPLAASPAPPPSADDHRRRPSPLRRAGPWDAGVRGNSVLAAHTSPRPRGGPEHTRPGPEAGPSTVAGGRAHAAARPAPPPRAEQTCATAPTRRVRLVRGEGRGVST